MHRLQPPGSHSPRAKRLDPLFDRILGTCPKRQGSPKPTYLHLGKALSMFPVRASHATRSNVVCAQSRHLNCLALAGPALTALAHQATAYLAHGLAIHDQLSGEIPTLRQAVHRQRACARRMGGERRIRALRLWPRARRWGPVRGRVRVPPGRRCGSSRCRVARESPQAPR